MKKLILVLSLLLVGTCVRAVTIGIEPPEKFMRALKTCTSGSYELEKDGLVLSYKIVEIIHPGPRRSAFVKRNVVPAERFREVHFAAACVNALRNEICAIPSPTRKIVE